MNRPTKKGETSGASARSSKAAAKKGVTKKSGAKTKKPNKAEAMRKAAEMVAKKRSGNLFVASLPNVSPVELAHLVVAMGLSSKPTGPLEAMKLLARCDDAIKNTRDVRQRLEDNYAKFDKEKNEAMLALGLDPEKPGKHFTLGQVVTLLRMETLMVGKETLSGESLWREFCTQTGQGLGSPLKDDDGGIVEGFTLQELLEVHRKYLDWRAPIAAANQRRGARNLPKPNKVGEGGSTEDLDNPASGDVQGGSPFTRAPKG
jgi:hypothetical protein